MRSPPQAAVLSLAQLLAEQPAVPPPGWIEPGLLPPQGILFVGGEAKVGKSLLVANLALALAARADCAEVIALHPLYSRHDQDENDTRSMAALCQSLLRLRDASKAALIVVHHVRKSIGRDEIGRALRGSSALHAVGDSYLLLARASANLAAVELRFQFRYAAPLAARLLQLEPHSLWFSAAGAAPSHARPRRKVEPEDVTKAL